MICIVHGPGFEPNFLEWIFVRPRSNGKGVRKTEILYGFGYKKIRTESDSEPSKKFDFRVGMQAFW